jgi:hypothetical protein
VSRPISRRSPEASLRALDIIDKSEICYALLAARRQPWPPMDITDVDVVVHREQFLAGLDDLLSKLHQTGLQVVGWRSGAMQSVAIFLAGREPRYCVELDCLMVGTRVARWGITQSLLSSTSTYDEHTWPRLPQVAGEYLVAMKQLEKGKVDRPNCFQNRSHDYVFLRQAGVPALLVYLYRAMSEKPRVSSIPLGRRTLRGIYRCWALVNGDLVRYMRRAVRPAGRVVLVRRCSDIDAVASQLCEAGLAVGKRPLGPRAVVPLVRGVDVVACECDGPSAILRLLFGKRVSVLHVGSVDWTVLRGSLAAQSHGSLRRAFGRYMIHPRYGVPGP